MLMLELLAPAGSMEALQAAVQNGANAVYLGCGTFNARQSAKNFTPQTLVEAVKYCHIRGVAVHLTLNTLVSDRETPEIVALIRHAALSGVDAFIVQDLGVVQLCRQIARAKPKKLIIFDIYENNAYEIQMELERKYPGAEISTLIGSIRDYDRMEAVFEKYRPNIVYHAAAHKHVPLMEKSPNEAIKNNVFGTYKTARAAAENGVEKFVMISTDKAVNPTNIMGASKRLCEMIIQSFDRKIRDRKAHEIMPLHVHTEDADGTMRDIQSKVVNPATEFVAVRFGNVLGSNGSVVPRFKEQIAKGGPVTVTHPDIIRYFMLIPEAVSALELFTLCPLIAEV